MSNFLNNWGPVAVIVAGYALGVFFQNRRLDDFQRAVDQRFTDLYRYLDVKFATVEERLAKLEKQVVQ